MTSSALRVIIYIAIYTRYQSKCRISVGIKITLDKANSLSIDNWTPSHPKM